MKNPVKSNKDNLQEEINPLDDKGKYNPIDAT